MKRELEYFRIGRSFGGNQDWFRDPMMKLGGCGAATACDVCIYLTMYKGISGLYPFDVRYISKKDYREFARIMKPYLHPRMDGINTADIYIDGFRRYLMENGAENSFTMVGINGTEPAEKTKRIIKEKIDDGIPVAYLMLRHHDKALKDFVWHWFLIVGYDESEDGFRVKTATYGEALWFDFDNMYHTGYEQKGGMVLFTVTP